MPDPVIGIPRTPTPTPISNFDPILLDPTIRIDGTFEGGGTLGAAYCGCLLALARNKIWFQRVAGNSAGAITASLIAAGYNANEIDFLFTPTDAPKVRPPGLPASLNQNEMNYSKFVDPPTSLDDISLHTRRNNMLFHLLKGTILDTIREHQVDLPPITQIVDRIVEDFLAKLPGQIGPFDWQVGGYDLEWNTGFPPPYHKVTVNVPKKTISVGPFGFSLSHQQKDAIREAVGNALSVYPQSLSLGNLGMPSTETQRQTFADAVMNAVLTADPIYRMFLNMAGDGGLLKGDVFLDTIAQLLEAKIGKSPVLFKHLPIPLAVIAADITDQTMQVYSSDRTPEMVVAEAVRRSMSIPFIYEPRIDDGHEIVDGGIVDNFPFWVHLIKQTPADMNRIKIGFMLDSSKEAPTAWNCPNSSHRDLNIAATTPEGLVDSITSSTNRASSSGSSTNRSLAEAKLLNRIADVKATQDQKNTLHTALRDMYRKHTSVKYYEVKVPLKGFFWLDFFVDKSTYNGMASRGWEATVGLISNHNIVPAAGVVSANPYK